MMAYIEREQAKEQILSNARIIQKPHLLSTDDTLYILDCLPTADVVEVKHGEWLDNHNGTYTCSICGGKAPKMAWCGHCGAKMTE